MATIPTTADLVRDRIIVVIESLTPAILSKDRFRRYRNEEGANFQKFCEAHPESMLRRFQVRDLGDDPAPLVTNCSIDEKMITFVILVAYPQTDRTGDKGALDRDTAMSRDMHAIKFAVGLQGRANFAPPNPDATWRTDFPSPRVVGKGVDFLQIRQTMSFMRSMP